MINDLFSTKKIITKPSRSCVFVLTKRISDTFEESDHSYVLAMIGAWNPNVVLRDSKPHQPLGRTAAAWDNDPSLQTWLRVKPFTWNLWDHMGPRAMWGLRRQPLGSGDLWAMWFCALFLAQTQLGPSLGRSWRHKKKDANAAGWADFAGEIHLFVGDSHDQWFQKRHMYLYIWYV